MEEGGGSGRLHASLLPPTAGRHSCSKSRGHVHAYPRQCGQPGPRECPLVSGGDREREREGKVEREREGEIGDREEGMKRGKEVWREGGIERQREGETEGGRGVCAQLTASTTHLMKASHHFK